MTRDEQDGPAPLATTLMSTTQNDPQNTENTLREGVIFPSNTRQCS